MRSRTTTQRSMIAADRPNHYIKVEVENADRVFQDLTSLGGVDWVEAVQWSDSLDSPTGSATVTLRRDTTSPALQSIAPTMGGSSLNRNGAGAYAPLLDTGRNLRISTAVTNPGVAPVSSDWKIMFIGRVDKVDWHAPQVTVDCRDLGGWIVDASIQTEKAYAINGPEAVEAVMAEILADTPVFGSPTLSTPVSPAWMINNTKKTVQARKSVLEALQQDWALSIGWVCRYVFDASDNFSLTFYDPNRTKTAPDDSFGPTEYRDITGLAIEDADVRNLINGIYFDSSGNKHTRTVQNTASQAKYGVRFMEIQLAAGDQIDTDDEMDRLLAAAVSDLGAPFATHEMETLYYWPVQLGDLYQFNPNLDHYDSAQDLAVVGFTHKFANGEGVTTIQCRGNVIGAFQAWLRRSAPGGTTADELSIKRITWNESADGKSREATVTCGDAVDTLHVHHRLWPDALTGGDPWDFTQSQSDAVTDELAIVRPSASDGLFRFSLPHPPRGLTVPGRLIPRAAPPSVVDGESMPIQILPAPPSIQVGIHPSRTGDTGALSINITVGVSDGPVHVDVIQDALAGPTTIVSVDLAGVAYTLDSSGYPALGGIALPAGKDYLSFRVNVTDVNGTVWPFGPAHLGRDPLADATATLLNYRAAPTAVIAFGPDTDAIRVTSHDGKTTTWNAAALLAAGSPVQYVLGTTARDDTSIEPLLVVDETRSSFKIEAEGGGTWTTILGPADLHGQPKNPPTALIDVEPNTSGDAEDVYVTPNTAVAEQLHVYFRDGDTDTALQWYACVGAADRTKLAVTAGTRLGPASYFARVDGVGSPTTKLAAIALTNDQVSRYGVMIEGADSGSQSPWLPVVLSLLAKPWLQSVELNYDPSTRTLSAIIVAGARVESAVALFADNALFSSPITASGNVSTGNTLTLSTVLSAAQLGKPWYVQVTPFNAVSLGGLLGDPEKASVAVPAIIGDPQVSASESGTNTTITISIDDPGAYLDTAWTNGTITGALHAALLDRGVTTLVAATTHTLVGTVHTWTFVVAQDALHPVGVAIYAHLIDGSTALVTDTAVDTNKIADLANSDQVVNGANEDYTLEWDTDTLVGANCARYSLDGGTTWTTVTVTSTLLSQFSIARIATAQTMLVQAKNALDGAWGNQSTIKVPPYITDVPVFAVQLLANTPDATHDRIVWSCAQGTATVSIDGGAFATPSASPIDVAKPAIGRHTYVFKFTYNNNSSTDEVDVLPVSADTITPNLDVALGTPTATTMPYTATTANPVSGGATPSITAKCVGCTMTISGTTYADGTTQTISTSTVVTGNKPASSSTTAGNLEFVATLGAATERIVVPVPPQSPIGGAGSVQVARNTPDSTHDRFTWSATRGTMTVSIDSGTYATPSASPWDVSNTSQHTYDWKLTADDGSVAPWHFDVGSTTPGGTTDLNGIFSALTNTIHAYGNPGTVDFAWTPSGFGASVVFEVWAMDVGKFGDSKYHLDGTTGTGATSYTYTAGESLSSSISPFVTIGFSLRAKIGSAYGTVSDTCEANYGSP